MMTEMCIEFINGIFKVCFIGTKEESSVVIHYKSTEGANEMISPT